MDTQSNRPMEPFETPFGMKRTKPRRRASSTFLALSAVILLCASLLQLAEAVCPSGCKCDDENLHVICVDANLDIVPITLNPSVEKIILRNNRIKTVDHGISFYLELVHIDLSHNHLVKIQANSFSKQTKLVQLNLNNNKISSLSNRTFGGFGSGNKEGLPSLAVVSLHDNLLEELEPGVFSYTPNIEELDLSQNKIKQLDANVTNGLSKLRVLKLNSNELAEVPPIFTKNTGDYGGMPHLAELFLGMNPINRIGNDAFSGLKNLGTLDLRECNLNSIEPNAFRGLTSLRKLILIDNKLRAIPSPQTLAPLAQLEVLKIGRNPISRIENMAFASLRKVKVIEMSGAPELAFVAQDAFVSNLDLETVEISSAKKLSELPPKLFKGISSLKNLSLKENSLGSVPEELASWQSLRSLRLEGNPFHCSCDLLWLRDLLQEKFRNSSFLVLCTEPKELAERKVSALSDKDMNCYLNSPMHKTVLGVSLGVAILVLIIFFYLMYRYHDKIKNMCKRKCFGRSNRSSRKSHRSSTPSTVKASELDHTNPLKSSFLSHSSAYPYSDEEYAIRTSLISPPPIPSSGPPGSYSLHHPSHMMHPQSHPSLHRNSMGPPGNGYSHSGIHSLGGHHHPHNYPSHSANSPYPSEYESVPINSLGLYPTTHHHSVGGGGGWGGGPLTSLSRGGGQDFNSHMSTLQPPMHYNTHQQVVKPIPITEL